jgi:hypothetical protein
MYVLLDEVRRSCSRTMEFCLRDILRTKQLEQPTYSTT